MKNKFDKLVKYDIMNHLNNKCIGKYIMKAYTIESNDFSMFIIRGRSEAELNQQFVSGIFDKVNGLIKNNEQLLCQIDTIYGIIKDEESDTCEDDLVSLVCNENTIKHNIENYNDLLYKLLEPRSYHENIKLSKEYVDICVVDMLTSEIMKFD